MKKNLPENRMNIAKIPLNFMYHLVYLYGVYSYQGGTFIHFLKKSRGIFIQGCTFIWKSRVTQRTSKQD